MRKPVVDYREFRLSRINEPRFSHLKLLLGWVAYFALYFLTENLIPLEKCHVMHCFLDDVIPFNELFVIPYTLWYVLIVGSLGYFALYNTDGFRRLSVFIMITQGVAMLVYIGVPPGELFFLDPRRHLRLRHAERRLPLAARRVFAGHRFGLVQGKGRAAVVEALYRGLRAADLLLHGVRKAAFGS